MHAHNELPALSAITTFDGDLSEIEFFDVKFYPYTLPGEDPVFAAVGGSFVAICRCVVDDKYAYEVLRVFSDEGEAFETNPNLKLNSLAWSQAPNGNPLVCVAGQGSHIFVLDVVTGELVTTLVGHGKNINDLVISPIDPTILASASEDKGLRIWNLDLAQKKEHTAAICFGNQTKDSLLTLAYHRKGQYILSAGMDIIINLWRVPDDLKEREIDDPAMIHYPHFSTRDVHDHYIDCIQWYNDLIISSAVKEDTISIWMIEGFNSNHLCPNAAPIPPSQTVFSDTKFSVDRSSFPTTHSAWGSGFQRLIQLDRPGHAAYYLRFSIFHQIRMHPILVAGNCSGQIFFWDLERLEDESADDEALIDIDGKSSVAQSPDTAESLSSKTRKTGTLRDIGDPFEPIKAHKSIVLPKYECTFRQFAWSNDGRWCIGSANGALMCVLHRWEDGVPEPEKAKSR